MNTKEYERELSEIDPHYCDFVLTDDEPYWRIDTIYTITRNNMTDDQVREWMCEAIKVLKKRMNAVSKTIKDPAGDIKMICKLCKSVNHVSKNC
jgi:hypothetical protein